MKIFGSTSYNDEFEERDIVCESQVMTKHNREEEDACGTAINVRMHRSDDWKNSVYSTSYYELQRAKEMGDPQSYFLRMHETETSVLVHHHAARICS